ncbi:MAG: 16S rRNA (guanine(527)-N(7))-methyltransferase RsmG [Desulfarculus sp.]|nr:16S rRNA (guanine(527)-N(7))-methyltransferase RsmG [Pseudomonadota bacterium]MBV1715040.1 16S rRNA (guanine(527)-N(7))-methyltransferase RsmG [Desulfarculus sp.]MBU4573317.1 16S rRNA (guanine(527)-N(7))-methyltransferase RsmG [Pseudomonadota bacterium]MBU4599687.1 16S rRNA (guanine(527)-N(7))-methyltransferase RsmG [Pseudomonadota bacterium]MBV1739916.1 16S rRNA (guanine(527)-N(7))-methyltransferase RsmG [Desulfarculus sp.]
MQRDLALEIAQRELPEGIFAAWERLSADLLRWNRAHNLTGHHDPAAAYLDLFLDSLALVPHVQGPALLDIGSGAGFPGLVLALALPELRVTLLEPRAKRVSFHKQAIRSLELGDRVQTVMGRAGEALEGEQFSTVTLRAVTDIPGSLELAQPYLAPGGAVLLPRGAKDADQARSLSLSVEPYSLGPGTTPRIIAIYRG